MSIAFLVDHLCNPDLIEKINEAIEGFPDVEFSIFIKGFCPVDKTPNCYISNVTNLSFFSGVIITFDIESTLTALNANGNYEIAYYPIVLEWCKRPIYFNTIYSAAQEVRVFAKNEEFYNALSNFTEHISIESDLKDLIKCLIQ